MLPGRPVRPSLPGRRRAGVLTGDGSWRSRLHCCVARKTQAVWLVEAASVAWVYRLWLDAEEVGELLDYHVEDEVAELGVAL